MWNYFISLHNIVGDGIFDILDDVSKVFEHSIKSDNSNAQYDSF